MNEGMSERVRKVEECDNDLKKSVWRNFKDTLRNYMGRKWKRKKRKRNKNELTGKNS